MIVTDRDYSQFQREHWIIFNQAPNKIFTVDTVGLIRIFKKQPQQELDDVRNNQPDYTGCAPHTAIRFYNDLP